MTLYPEQDVRSSRRCYRLVNYFDYTTVVFLWWEMSGEDKCPVTLYDMCLRGQGYAPATPPITLSHVDEIDKIGQEPFT